MKVLKWLTLTAIAAFGTSSALADTWCDGTISEIRVVANGNSADSILVLGTFNPSLGCTYSGFQLAATDPYFNQVYAALLAAQISGSPIRYLHSYCQSNGYGRGNAYSVVH